MKLRALPLLAFPLLVGLPLAAQPNNPLPTVAPDVAGFTPERLDRLHAMLDRTVDDGTHSGYIVLIARDGSIVDWRAHGFADLATRRPLERDSIVRMYSMTKIVTSVAAMILVEEGRLRLSDRVDQYLPAFASPKVFVGGTADAPELVDAAGPITVEQLLTHTAGLFYDFSGPPALVELQQRANPWGARNLDEFVARAATVPLADQPGTAFRYGIATDLLGSIVEKVSGQSLAEFFRQRILEPLAMHDSGFWVPQEKRDRLAHVYQRNTDGTMALPAFFNNDDFCGPDRGPYLGGQGLFSTAADYVRFAQMLLNDGELDGVRILGRKTVELMTRDHLGGLVDPHPFGAKSQGFGLGVRVTTNLGAGQTLGSDGAFGWDGAATTTVQIDPQERTVALLLFQHTPFNEGDVITLFTNSWYSALEN